MMVGMRSNSAAAMLRLLIILVFLAAAPAFFLIISCSPPAAAAGEDIVHVGFKWPSDAESTSTLLRLPAASSTSAGGDEDDDVGVGVEFLNKVEVHILNRLGGGKELGLHCKSRDDDLGQRSVADGGEWWWRFRTNLWGTTLFSCDLSGTPNPNFGFVAFDYARDESRCKSQCHWLVAGEGMYGKNQATGLWEFFYAWDD